jgi:hypothetical protein
MKTKLTYYVIADLSPVGGDTECEITKHEFDLSDDEDRNALGDYLEDEGEDELNVDNFPMACKKFIYENVIMDYNQGFISAITLTEEQFNLVRNYKGV